MEHNLDRIKEFGFENWLEKRKPLKVEQIK
jgi:hypothetical protein